MTVRHELTRLRTAQRQIDTIDGVIQSTLEKLEKRLTGLARNTRRLAEVVLELGLEYTIVTAHLLLLAKLTSVLADLGAGRFTLRLLTRRRTTALDSALFRKATIALE